MQKYKRRLPSASEQRNKKTDQQNLHDFGIYNVQNERKN